MADAWDLTKYVEAHPDNLEQRWRLAKKLYKEGEYRLATEHLQILDNEWKDKSSIPRYLAATYSRLSRFEDAVTVLERAVEVWSDDVKMREQLAMMYVANGNKDAAKRAWAEVLVLDPKHPYAKSAGRSIARKQRKDFARESGSDSVFSASKAIVCAQCGAENTAELTTCWRCKTSLDLVGDIVGEQSERPRQRTDFFTPTMIVGIVLSALYGMYSTYRALTYVSMDESVFKFPLSLTEILTYDLLSTRIIIGLAVIIALPFVHQGVLFAAGLRRIESDESLLQALFFGTASYAFTWVPGMGFTNWILSALGVTLAVTVASFWRQWVTIAQVWILQCTLIGVLIGTLLSAMHGTSMVFELRGIERFLDNHPAAVILETTGQTPMEARIQFESTGSDWADGLADIAGIQVLVEEDALVQNVQVEVRSETSVIIYRTLTNQQSILYLEDIQPGTEYTLRITADLPVAVTSNAVSVLPVRIESD